MAIESTTISPAGVIDFRTERLRRALRRADATTALTVAKHYAESGLAEAQYLLAEMLASSDRPEDLETAKRWFETAAHQGHVDAGKRLWRVTVVNAGAGALDRSLADVIMAADLGDFQASGVLIGIYGQKPDAPVPNMLAYLQRHVERGHASAQFALALAYDYGHHGLSPNPEKAFELYLLAAKQGDAQAQCCLGICYAYGRGVQQDAEQAVHWYREAARRGSAQAQCNVGYSHEIGRKPLAKSMLEANRWYRRSAMRDFPDAQYNLGLSYQLGRELPQDHRIANRWFARAAKQGMAPAQCSLGLSYERGRGVTQDFGKAAELYSAAARAGNAQAQQNYGYLLESGLGVERDLSEAARWYRTAADQGLTSAQSCLAFMYENGNGVEKNLDEALTHYQRAASQNDERGIEGVARITWQQQLLAAKNALTILEGQLKDQDPAYEKKKAFLVPILKPLFKQLPPSKWAAAFEEAYAGIRFPVESTIPPQSEPVAQPRDSCRQPAKESAAASGAPGLQSPSDRAPFICRWWRHRRRVVNIAVEQRGEKRREHRHVAYVECLRCGRAEAYNGMPLGAAEVAERQAAARRAARSFVNEDVFASPDPTAEPVIITRPAGAELRYMRRVQRHSGFIVARRGLLALLCRWQRLATLDAWLQRRWNVWHAKQLFRSAGLQGPQSWDEIVMITTAARIDRVLADYYDTEAEMKKLRHEVSALQESSKAGNRQARREEKRRKALGY